MKLLALLLIALPATPAHSADYAACTGLLEGKDSTTFQIPQVDVYHPKQIIKDMMTKYCGYAKISDFTCRRFKADDAATEVCYAETPVGYFFITRDYMENVNIIVSRWD
jgi:hypothetical protein